MVMAAVQVEFARKELQYRLMRDDFEQGYDHQESDTNWNPYDNDIQLTDWDNESNTNRLRLM